MNVGDEVNDVYDAQASDLVKLGTAHTVRLSLEYKNNRVDSPQIFEGTAGYDDYAASAMWNWQITRTLALTNAVRADWMQIMYSGAGRSGFRSDVVVHQRAFDPCSELQFRTGLAGNPARHRAPC